MSITTHVQQADRTDAVLGNIRAELGRRRISINKLSVLVGPNQTYWNRRLSGSIRLSIDDLFELADFLGIEVGVLFAGTQNGRHPMGDGQVLQMNGRSKKYTARDLNPEPAD